PADAQPARAAALARAHCLAVAVPESARVGHYAHFCKQILWPFFHYQIPDNPRSKVYEDHSWHHYLRVNHAFAAALVRAYSPGDRLWIHDYHLLLVPALVRKALPNANIGFFLHVAFPSSEVFRCLAVRKDLLAGMLGANLVAFQTAEYSHHFLQTCSRVLGVEATATGVYLPDRFVHVTDIPIGIDICALHRKLRDPAVLHWIALLKQRYDGKKILVGRDKLDHVKGVRQKMLGFERFLQDHPHLASDVVFIQVALSTTEQNELSSQVVDTISRINSSHANLAYDPVVFLHQDITYEQYLALLTVADVLVITSLREGMNLTCHEYVVCQETRKKPLILSEFTGSSTVFQGAILVNPWDTKRVASCIYQALQMSPQESASRWQKMWDYINSHTAENWTTTFLDKLDSTYNDQQRHQAQFIKRFTPEEFHGEYKNARNRLFLLDYEGTLVSWGSPGDVIMTSPQHTIDLLNDLLSDPRNSVWIFSDSTSQDIQKLANRVNRLGLVAEYGCLLRRPNSNFWEIICDNSDWRKPVLEILEYYAERTPGSKIIKGRVVLKFQWDKCEELEFAARQASEIANHINDACTDKQVHAIPTEGTVLVLPTTITKTSTAQKILKEQSTEVDVDFVVVAGDDRGDEPVFEWAARLEEEHEVKSVVTISVGAKQTAAKRWVAAVNGLVAGLNGLCVGHQPGD
ncbi:putative alpha,alpha-trehalose-phosphate synthase [UDP-forming] subunit, partial [Neolecta irregularis DAH-3]